VKGLDGFADSDWGNSASRKSTSGLLARYNRSLLVWRSNMQKTIVLSTAEAEYHSVSEMAIEMINLRNLLAKMGLPQEDYTDLFKDNTACIKWSNYVLGGRERAKYIDSSTHFAHEAVKNGHIWLYQILTEHQLADLLTTGNWAHLKGACKAFSKKIHRVTTIATTWRTKGPRPQKWW
jgi:hypothetical protein